jgi:hypothetical protein
MSNTMIDFLIDLTSYRKYPQDSWTGIFIEQEVTFFFYRFIFLQLLFERIENVKL